MSEGYLKIKMKISYKSEKNKFKRSIKVKLKDAEIKDVDWQSLGLDVSKMDFAQKENEKLTDSMDFHSGNSKKPEKTLRMQDIPPEELEKYIAKYI